MGLGFHKFGNAGSRGQVGAEEKEAGELGRGHITTNTFMWK